MEGKSECVVKSFHVTGTVKKPECTRSYDLQREIRDIMKDIFGPDHYHEVC